MRLLSHSLGRFSVVGILNTVVGLCAIYLAMGIGGMGVVESNVFGYAVGLSVGFLMNRRWTFRNNKAAGPALLRYLLVVAVAYLCNLATVTALTESLGVNAFAAQTLGIIPYTALSYLGSRHFAFSSST